MSDENKCYICGKGQIVPEGWIGAPSGAEMTEIAWIGAPAGAEVNELEQMHEPGRCSDCGSTFRRIPPDGEWEVVKADPG